MMTLEEYRLLMEPDVRRAVEAKPAPEAPPEKYYPHGRPPRETAGHAKSAAARTAKDRGKKKKPPTGKGSS